MFVSLKSLYYNIYNVVALFSHLVRTLFVTVFCAVSYMFRTFFFVHHKGLSWSSVEVAENQKFRNVMHCKTANITLFKLML